MVTRKQLSNIKLERNYFAVCLIVITAIFLVTNIDKFYGIKKVNELNLARKNLSSDSMVFIKKNISDYLNDRFNKESLEFAVCMYGQKQGNNYTINRLTIPAISERNESFVRYTPCPLDSLGSLHSHPKYKGNISVCWFSESDFYYFGFEKSILFGIICDTNNFVIMKHTNVKSNLPIKIID